MAWQLLRSIYVSIHTLLSNIHVLNKDKEMHQDHVVTVTCRVVLRYWYI